MSDAPERIWLQTGGDYENAHLIPDAVTWCADPIDYEDDEYVRADIHAAVVAERDALRTGHDAGWLACRDYIAARFDAKAAWHRDWERRHTEAGQPTKALFEGGRATDFEHEAQAIRALSQPMSEEKT